MCFKVLLVTLAAASVESLPQFFQPQFGFQRQFLPVYDESVFVDRRSLPQRAINSHKFNQDFGVNDGQYPQYESLKIQPSESFENRHTSDDLPDYQENYGSDTFKVQGREQEHLTDHFQNDFSNSGVNTQRNQLSAAQPLHTQQNTEVRNVNTQNTNYDYRRTEKPIARNPVKIETRVSQNVDVTTNTYQNNNDYSPNEDQHPNENQFPKNNSVQNIEVLRTNKTQQTDKNNNINIKSRPTTFNVRQEGSGESDSRKAFNTNTYVNNENYHNSNTNTIRRNLTDTGNINSNADKTNKTYKQDDKVSISTNTQQHGSNTNKQTARPYTSENVDDVTNSKNEVQKSYFESKSKQGGNLPQGPEEGDKWIWGYSGVTETEAPVSTVDLDDRASFDAAMCPAGKVKVEGMCIKVDT